MCGDGKLAGLLAFFAIKRRNLQAELKFGRSVRLKKGAKSGKICGVVRHYRAGMLFPLQCGDVLVR